MWRRLPTLSEGWTEILRKKKFTVAQWYSSSSRRGTRSQRWEMCGFSVSPPANPPTPLPRSSFFPRPPSLRMRLKRDVGWGARQRSLVSLWKWPITGEFYFNGIDLIRDQTCFRKPRGQLWHNGCLFFFFLRGGGLRGRVKNNLCMSLWSSLIIWILDVNKQTSKKTRTKTKPQTCFLNAKHYTAPWS